MKPSSSSSSASSSSLEHFVQTSCSHNTQPRTMFTIDELLKETTSRSGGGDGTRVVTYSNANELEQREVVNNILNGSSATSHMFRFFQVNDHSFRFLFLLNNHYEFLFPGVSQVFWISFSRSSKSSFLQTISTQILS